MLQQMVNAYAEQRLPQESEILTAPDAQGKQGTDLHKDDRLQPTEAMEAIEFLLRHYVTMEMRRLKPLFPTHTEATLDLLARSNAHDALESIVKLLKLDA
jgi:hypothetical protein